MKLHMEPHERLSSAILKGVWLQVSCSPVDAVLVAVEESLQRGNGRPPVGFSVSKVNLENLPVSCVVCNFTFVKGEHFPTLRVLCCLHCKLQTSNLAPFKKCSQ